VDGGEIRIAGRSVTIRTPADGIAAGIALVPEDRRVLGLVPMLDVGKNLTLAYLTMLSSAGFINNRLEQALVREYATGFNIHAPSTKVQVSALSGGNQQKVVLGKWLSTKPSVLILDEPTRGIDVGTKAEIRARIDALAERGMAILFISSELPEILGMSDRILVMREGRIAAEYARAEFSEEKIGSCAIAGV
jgi:ABC-type sugar transport system ATPase subunit